MWDSLEDIYVIEMKYWSVNQVMCNILVPSHLDNNASPTKVEDADLLSNMVQALSTDKVYALYHFMAFLGTKTYDLCI